MVTKFVDTEIKVMYLIILILSIIVFQQHLSNTKLELDIITLNRTISTLRDTDSMRKDQFHLMQNKYRKWNKMYGHMREQNYILTKKFRKTDSLAYRKYLTNLVKEANGIGGDK